MSRTVLGMNNYARQFRWRLAEMEKQNSEKVGVIQVLKVLSQGNENE